MEVPAVDEIWQHIHPEVLKRVCDDKLAEAGVELLLAVKVADVIRSGGRIDALAVATSRGLKKVTASIFVDATGDGWSPLLRASLLNSGTRRAAR